MLFWKASELYEAGESVKAALLQVPEVSKLNLSRLNFWIDL